MILVSNASFGHWAGHTRKRKNKTEANYWTM